MKQMKTCKMRFKPPQNGNRLSLKPTPRSKRNGTREKHMRDDTYKNKITWLAWETRLAGG
jgi:hypothetical protein